MSKLFKNLVNCFLKLYHFTFPPAVYERTSFSTSLSILDIGQSFYFCYLDGCAVVFHCDFTVHFLND